MSNCGISSSLTAASNCLRSARAPGGHNGELNLARSVKILGFGRADHIQCAVRAAKATLAVGHHRQVHVGTTDAAVRTEFAQCFAVVASGVSRQANRFTYRREASSAAACGKGVLECELRLNVDQTASHDQVLGDPPCALFLEGLDLVASGAVQFLTRDVLINFRGSFAVRTVGATDVLGVGNPCRPFFPGPATLTAVAAEVPRSALRAVAEGLAVTAVVVERAAFAVAGRAIATVVVERLPVTVATEGATVIVVAAGTIKVPRSALRDGRRRAYGRHGRC
jgi:hypothetical protein